MNPRPDLLALTPDDLAVLTNRGTVKRAQRELESAEVSAKWEADETGRIAATWSDGAVCEVPAGKTVRDARCNCPAAELCRHIVRTVLAWQARESTAAESAGAPAAPAEAAPWNPGSLTDAHLDAHSAKGLVAKARQRWADGVLVECVIAVKPSTRFYDLGLTVRFAVPGDVRYSHCDCGQPGPCLHALLAVLAFRRMADGQTAALISSGASETPADGALLAEAERVVTRLIEDGIGGIPASEADRWKRCASSLSDAGLVWLSGIVGDLMLERERYLARDALFSPDNVAMLAGELLIRSDALRYGKALPRGMAGGWKSSEKTDVGYTRWIGMGTAATLRRKSVALAAFMQEAATGSLGAVVREVADPPDGADPAEFASLSRAGVVKGAGIRALGAGQIITESCRRTPDNRLSFGRARAQVSTQAFEWEKLRAPVLVEDYAELRARLSLLPPRCLRPRRDGEDFYVLPVAANSSADFDHATQTLSVALTDTGGRSVILTLPWTSRSAAGFDRIARRLTENAALFVSGSVALTPAGLSIVPAGVVLRGENRMLIQPWVDEAEAEAGAAGPVVSRAAADEQPEALAALPAAWKECGRLLMDMLVTGCGRIPPQHADRWRQLCEDAEPEGCRMASQTAGAICEALRRAKETVGVSAAIVFPGALVAWRSAVDLV